MARPARLATRAKAASGIVYLVGAGPGAPDLLTLRAASVLARADVVFHDALVNPEIMALATHASKITVGKRCGKHSTAQRFINKRLVDAAAIHEVVVRLKGGDPMLFGRAQEEMDALEAAGIRYEVVPGVTAALAAAAEIRTSLTQRGSVRSVTFVTPRVGDGESTSDWAASIAAADGGAIYMGARQAQTISIALIGAGKPPSTPVAIVECASLSGSRVLYGTLAGLPRLAKDAVNGPALIFIGPQFRARARAALSDERAETTDREAHQTGR